MPTITERLRNLLFPSQHENTNIPETPIEETPEKEDIPLDKAGGFLWPTYAGKMLVRHGIHSVKELQEMSLTDLYSIRDLHPSAIAKIRSELKAWNIVLQENSPNWNFDRKLISEAVRASQISIDNMNLSNRSRNLLKRSDYETAADILYVGQDLLNIYSFGQTSLNEVQAKIKDLGFQHTEELAYSSVFHYLAEHPQEYQTALEALNQQNLSAVPEQMEASQRAEAILAMDIEELDLSVRAYNCLKRTGIRTCGDLVALTNNDLVRIRNLGNRCANEVVSKLAQFGLKLTPELGKHPDSIENRKPALDSRIRSVAHYTESKEIQKAVLDSDVLRNETLNICYKIPGYQRLPREDANKLYDLVKKAISLSKEKTPVQENTVADSR